MTGGTSGITGGDTSRSMGYSWKPGKLYLIAVSDSVEGLSVDVLGLSSDTFLQ